MADDWAQRSTAPGVIAAYRLDTQAEVEAHIFSDSTADHISFDSSIKPSASSGGSQKHVVLSTDGAASGQTNFPYGQSFGNGSVHWVSFRARAPAQFFYQPWPGTIYGHKLAIISEHTQTNQEMEVVWQSTYNRGIVDGYWQIGSGSYDFVDAELSTACNGSDFTRQPAIDNGADPLTGNDPDDGVAFSDSSKDCHQDRARYAGLYSAGATPAADYAEGYGDPIDGGFRLVPDEWLTFTVRIQVGTFGGANSRLTWWAARENQPYVKLADMTGRTLGIENSYDQCYLLPYTTDRTAGGTKITSTMTPMSGVTLLVCGLGCPSGDGSLFWDVSEQKFQWKGAGGTYGTARGFSAANGKLILNVKDSVNSITGSYVTIQVDPDNLPVGDTTATVTISTAGRPDTQINYAELIISTMPINATGGYAPTVLGQAAYDLAVGAWGAVGVSESNQDAILGVGTTLGTMVSGSPTPWNPISARIEIIGMDHAWGKVRHAYYDDLTNLWVLASADLGFGTDTQHQYNHNAINPYTGDFYYSIIGDGSSTIKSRKHTFVDVPNTWSDLPNTPDVGYNQVARGVCWWRGAFTGGGAQGSFMVYNSGETDGHIAAYNPLTNTWFWDDDNMSPGSVNSYHTAMAYSTVHNIAIFGGGQDAGGVVVNSNQVWRLNADGTTDQLPDLPGSYIWGGYSYGHIIEDPVTGNFLLLAGGELWELDPTGDGAWTQKTSPPTEVGDPATGTERVCLIPIHEYGVVAFVTQNNTTVGNFYLYKNAGAVAAAVVRKGSLRGLT